MTTRLTARRLTAVAVAALATTATAAPPPAYPFTWATVVNNGDYMPTAACNPAAPTVLCRTFSRYNQPSVNADQVVVIRRAAAAAQGWASPSTVSTHATWLRSDPW